MDQKDVAHLAHLARIDIPEEEQKALLEDLKAMIAYVDQVQSVDVAGREQVLGDHYNSAREDNATTVSGSKTDALLKEAPFTQDGFVKVPKIL